jgi:hypothetical protein
VLAGVLSEADFVGWGWRIPFLLSIALIVVGIYVRIKVEETPLFKAQVETVDASTPNPLSVISVHGVAILRLILAPRWPVSSGFRFGRRPGGGRVMPASRWLRPGVFSGRWRGRPLTSHQIVVDLISATSTQTGLTVRAELDTGAYLIAIKYTRKKVNALPITGHDFHGEWTAGDTPTST